MFAGPGENVSVNNSDLDNEEAIDDQNLIPETVVDTAQCMKARTVLGIMGFLGFANVYAMRVNLSVAIVAMVNSTVVANNITNTTLDVCPALDPTDNTTIPLRNGDFNWDEKQQGIVLGSFFYGYVLTQIPGGRLAELFGGKRVFGVGVLLTGLFTLLSPLAAYWSYPMFIAIRVLEGIGEGVTFPAMHAMLARWIPPVERSKFAALVYAGSNFGTIISLPVSAWLCTLEYAGGWPLCFYLFGGISLIWYVAWLLLVYDTPQTHPRICPKERDYISWSIGPHHAERKRGPIPWGHFARCVPLWAILITQCGMSWQFYTQLTELPSYMNNILHMNLERNALLSAMPYLTSWLAGIVISIFADWLVSKDYISQVNSYKLWNTIASVVPSLGLLGVAWVGCDQLSVLLLLAFTGAFGGAVYAGNQMNHMTLSPQYAGTMYGITNAAANLCGFLAPYAIGVIIQGQLLVLPLFLVQSIPLCRQKVNPAIRWQETLSQWRVVFYLASAVNLGANLFYLMFASAEEEQWSIEESQRASDSGGTTPLLEESIRSTS